MIRVFCVLLVVLLAAGDTAAKDLATPQAAADAVLAALAKQDAAAVKAIARATDPDPWLVAQELLRRGGRTAAAALAAGGKGPATRGLAAAVRDFPPAARAEVTWAALASAKTELASKRRAEALEALADQPGDDKQGILAVEVHSLRGRILGSTETRDPQAWVAAFEASASAYEAAAAEAERLGWYTRASADYYEAGLALWMIGGHSATERMAALFQRLTEVEKQLGSEVGHARGLYRVAIAFSDLGRDEEALRLLKQAEPALRRAGDHEYLGRSLGHRASISDRRGDTRGALDLSCESADFLARATGSGLPLRFKPDQQALLSVRVIRWLTCASWATKLGKVDQAKQYEDSALVAADLSADAGLKQKVAAFRAVLAGVRHQLAGRYLNALDAFARAEAIYGSQQLTLEAANVQRRMSSAHQALGDLPRALRAAEGALDTLKRGGTPRDVGSTLVQLARIEIPLGKTAQAGTRLREALTLAKAAADPELTVEASMWTAELQRLGGNISASILELEDAERLADEHGLTLPRGHVRRMLGELLVRTGTVERAKQMFVRAREDFTAAGSDADLGLLRMSEGVMHLELGDWAAARADYEAALELQQSASIKPKVLVCYDMLGRIAFEQKDYARAAMLAGEAHRLAEDMGFPGRVILALVSRGRALDYGKRFDEAEAAFAAAVKAAEDYPDPETQAVLAHHMADVRYQQGKFAKAIAWATKGANAAKSYGLGLAEGEDAALRGALLHNLYSIGRRAAIALGNLEALHDFMERARASTLVAALGGADSLRSVDVPADLREDEEVARAATARLKASYRRAARRPDKRTEAGRIAQELKVAQDALQRAVTAVRRKARSQADLTYGDVTALGEFQKTLGTHDLAILYVREKSKRPGGTLYALRVRPEPEPAKQPVKPRESAIQLIDLGAASAVDAAIKALYTDPSARVNASQVSTLADLLFKGIDRKGVERLWISPGESLATVPFGLLDTERDVALLPSVTAMGMLKGLEGAGGAKVLSLGNAIYGKKGGYKDLSELPETELEAKDVGDTVLLAKDASETGFYTKVQEEARWRAVHFACHGIVDMERATRSWLALTADDENDGRLDAREVFNLSVPADLVVLSGCETGRGQVIRGDGLTGLMRAFMQAGAPRVICSLWKVPDDSTRLLMQEFYKRWNPKGTGAQRMTACAALRAAQKAVREHTVGGKQPFAHPEDWAAWVVWGSPN